MTRLLRSKEEAHDYRYFPEPDLPPLVVTAARMAAIRAGLPELPWMRRARLDTQYGLPAADARVLTAARELADYFEAAAAALPSNPKGIANWVQGEVLRDVRERARSLARTIAPARLAALVAMVDAGTISNSAAKEVFAAIAPTGEEPAAAVERLGLAQVSDSAEIERWIDEVIAREPGAGGAVPRPARPGRRLPGRPGDEALGRPRRAEGRAAAHEAGAGAGAGPWTDGLMPAD